MVHAVLFIVLLLAQDRGTLTGEVTARGLPMPPRAVDLERRLTSYSVMDDDKGFVIAYYTVEPDGGLHELRVRSFDRRTRTWNSAVFREPIGSVLSIVRGGELLYVQGHSSPSASPLLVLTKRLAVKRELDGWPMLVLDDGRLVFSRSMRHFAPTHAQVLALYDPATNRDLTLYPAGVDNDRGAEQRNRDIWVDRTIDEVTRGRARNTIQFRVRSQQMRLNRHQIAEPAAPEESFAVTCNLSTRVCR